MDLSKQDLSKIPALKPPPGVTPNFENPENFFGTIIGTIVVCLTLTTFLAWTRIYTRLFITKSISWDDCQLFPQIDGLHCSFFVIIANSI